MIKNKRFISPILCAVLMISSQQIHCNWFLGFPLSLFSITCHTLGGFAGVVTGVFTSRAVLSGLVKKSETKQASKLFEVVVGGIAKGLGGKDEAAGLANWFSSGNPESDGVAALMAFVTCVALHGTGFISAFLAGRTTVSSSNNLPQARKKSVTSDSLFNEGVRK